MKNTRFKKILRITSLFLILLFVFPLMSACKARPLSQTKLSKTEVGKVGEYSVLYEELYFLANNYCNSIKNRYGDDTTALNNELWSLVNKNIVSNYAILELCRSEGLIYDEKSLKEDVEAHIERQIESDFNGSRSDYFNSMEASGLTDHYVRFVTGVDILYNKLDTQYKTSGVLPNSDEELLSYIKSNFAHTWHVAVFVNEGDDRDAKLKKAQDALALLESGTSMYELIGSKYNEDLNPGTLKDTYGYCFPRGIMEKEYEQAAFSLGIGKHTQIITGVGENNYGQQVECFYIIERLPLTDDEIEANFVELSDMISASIISEKMETHKSNLSFEPNDFAKNLDLSALEAPKNGVDYQAIIIAAACVVACGAIVVSIVLIRKIKVRKFHQQNKSIKKK